MALADRQAELDFKSTTCISEIDNFEQKVTQSIAVFLDNPKKDWLVLETSDTKLVSVLVLQALRKLRANLESNNVHLELENQIFLEWQQFVEIAVQKKEMPTFKKLLVCEVSHKDQLTKHQGIFKKLIGMLLGKDSMKMIFIAPNCDLIEICMQKVTIAELIRVNDLISKPIPLKHNKLIGAKTKNILYQTILKGSIQEVGREIINITTNINKVKGPDGRKVMHAAAERGHEDAFFLLTAFGANAKVRDRKKDTPLHFAVRRGHKNIILPLLLMGVDINLKDRWQRTALHWATERGDRALVYVLLKHRAEKNTTDQWNQTPLHLAARNGHRETALILLKNNASVNTRCKKGLTALQWAARNGHNHIVQDLLQYKANIKAKDYVGSTALHYAALNGHEAVVETLLTWNAETTFVNMADKKRNTALHNAVSEGNTYITLAILKRGIDKDIKGHLERTALHLAAERGCKAIVWMLVNHDADKNVLDSNQYTPLHLAIKNDHLDIALILIRDGAEVDLKDHRKRTALHLAAATIDSMTVIQKILQRGANIKAQDAQGWTALHFASYNESKPVVEWLLQHGADVNAKDQNGYSSLHWASYVNHYEIVKLLVESEETNYIKLRWTWPSAKMATIKFFYISNRKGPNRLRCLKRRNKCLKKINF